MTITSVNDGSSDKFYRAWADSADGSKGFSTTDSSKEYFGVYAGTTPPSNYKAYSWTKIKGEAGRSVVDTEMEYAINDSKTTPPTTGWSLETPVWKTGLYIWQRVKVSYSSGNPSYTTPHCIESNIIEDVTGNIGDWIFRDKTEVLSGTEIFTDKADADAVVHVEIDGKSYQHAGSGKNLFNGYIYDGFIDAGVGRTDTPIPLNQSWPNSLYSDRIYVKPNTRYNLSGFTDADMRVREFDSDGIYISSNVGKTFTSVSTTSFVRILWHKGLSLEEKVGNIQLEEGSIATEYEPPAPTPDYPIEIHSLNNVDVVSSVGRENLLSNSHFNGSDLNGWNSVYGPHVNINSLSIKTFTVDGGSTRIQKEFELNEVGEFTFSIYAKTDEVSSTHNRIEWRGFEGLNAVAKNENFVDEYGVYSITFTNETPGKKIIRGYIPNVEVGSKIYIEWEKLERGDTSTSWNPSVKDALLDSYTPNLYKSNLLLDEPLRSVGDVKDRLFRDTDGLWKVERNVERINVNDSNVNFYPNYHTENYYSFAIQGLASRTKNIISSHLPRVVSVWNTERSGIYTSAHGTWLQIPKSFVSSVSELKTKGIEVQYESETPTIETLPQSLQDKLNNIASYANSNYVYTVLPDKSDILSEKLKPTLHATFKSIAWANDFKYKFEQAKAMHSTDIWFAKGVSNTIAPNIGWSTDAPVWEDGLYIWSKTITTYGNGRTEETSPVCITGATGRSVDKIEEWYYLSNKSNSLEGGTWSKTPPTWTDGKYIWTKNKIIYKNPSGSEETSPINTTGGSGQKGDSGTDAKTVRLGNIIHAVHFDQDGLMPSVSSIAFPTAIQGFSGLTPYYEFKMGNTIVRGLSTDSSWTLNTSNMKYSDFPLTVSVNVVINGQTMVTDTVTIVGTKPGEDAYTVVLANESHTFVGDVSNAIAGSTTANVIAYRGGTQVGATIGSITGLPTGMTSTIYSNGTTAARVTFTVTTSMTSPNGVVNIPVTVNGKTFTKVFNYAIAFKGAKGDKGTDGIAGKDGVGIKSTVLAYASSTSGTTTPSSGWQTTVPTVAAGNYLWTRTTWTYTDNSVENGYTVSRIGKDGNTGKDGVAGKDGVGISKTVIHYASSTSGTTAPTSGWITTVPSVAQGSYLWTRTTWTYTDGTNETGYSAARMGANGATGAKGDKGNPGENATARNYLLDSKPSSIIHTAAYNIADFILAEAPVSGETYSFVLKGELASTKTNFSIYNTDGSSPLGTLSHKGNGIYSLTFPWIYGGKERVKIYALTNSQTGNSKIEWVTMVKGSVPLTEWVPAHEDLQKGIDELENAVNNTSPTGENLIVNGGFENSKGHQAYGWSPSYELHSVGHSGSKALVWRAHPTTQTLTHLARVPVEPGRTYEYGYWACSSADANGVAGNNKMRLGRSDGSYLSDLGINGAVNNNGSWVKYTREYTIPNDVHEVIVSLNSNNTVGWYKIDDVFMYDITDRKSIDQKADGSATESALNEAAAKLQVLQQEIEAAATSNELKDFIDKYNKDMASRDKDARESESSLSTALASINSIQTNMGDMSATWQFVNRFIKNTPQGIVVGNDSSGSYILIKEDRLAFYSNGQEVAFISQNLMEISRGAFVEQIQIAKYQFEESTTKHLTVRFVG